MLFSLPTEIAKWEQTPEPTTTDTLDDKKVALNPTESLQHASAVALHVEASLDTRNQILSIRSERNKHHQELMKFAKVLLNNQAEMNNKLHV